VKSAQSIADGRLPLQSKSGPGKLVTSRERDTNLSRGGGRKIRAFKIISKADGHFRNPCRKRDRALAIDAATYAKQSKALLFGTVQAGRHGPARRSGSGCTVQALIESGRGKSEVAPRHRIFRKPGFLKRGSMTFPSEVAGSPLREPAWPSCGAPTWQERPPAVCLGPEPLAGRSMRMRGPRIFAGTSEDGAISWAGGKRPRRAGQVEQSASRKNPRIVGSSECFHLRASTAARAVISVSERPGGLTRKENRAHCGGTVRGRMVARGRIAPLVPTTRGFERCIIPVILISSGFPKLSNGA